MRPNSNPYSSKKKTKRRATKVSTIGYGYVTILKPDEKGRLVPIKKINPDTGRTIQRYRKG